MCSTRKMAGWGRSKPGAAGSPLYLGQSHLISVVAFESGRPTQSFTPHQLSDSFSWHRLGVIPGRQRGQLSGTHRTEPVSCRLHPRHMASANEVHTSAQQPANVMGHIPRWKSSQTRVCGNSCLQVQKANLVFHCAQGCHSVQSSD